MMKPKAISLHRHLVQLKAHGRLTSEKHTTAISNAEYMKNPSRPREACAHGVLIFFWATFRKQGDFTLMHELCPWGCVTSRQHV